MIGKVVRQNSFTQRISGISTKTLLGFAKTKCSSINATIKSVYLYITAKSIYFFKDTKLSAIYVNRFILFRGSSLSCILWFQLNILESLTSFLPIAVLTVILIFFTLLEQRCIREL